MEINIMHLVEGAQKARGLTVIIDVFRAFSVACYAFDAGVDRIYPVGDIQEAYDLKREDPARILVGERKEQKPKGFDYGNSPSQIIQGDILGKTMVHTTSAGTQGMVNATGADEVLTGAFVNASAIVRYIQQKNPPVVSLVGMGYSARYPIEEDVACAQYIANELQGRDSDFEGMKQHIRKTSGARFFLEEKQSFAPRIDFDLCMNLNRFNFVIRRELEQGQMVLNRISL